MILATAMPAQVMSYGLAAAAQDKEGLPLTCRAVFIIGPDKKLKLSLNYPASVGRNMDGAPNWPIV
jgi:alkyl hydroperoxide reductase subunit AhpC